MHVDSAGVAATATSFDIRASCVGKFERRALDSTFVDITELSHDGVYLDELLAAVDDSEPIKQGAFDIHACCWWIDVNRVIGCAGDGDVGNGDIRGVDDDCFVHVIGAVDDDIRGVVRCRAEGDVVLGEMQAFENGVRAWCQDERRAACRARDD